MRITLTGWLLLASSLIAFAEQPSAKKAEGSTKPADPIPSYQISLRMADPVPGIPFSPVTQSNPSCAADGTMLVHFVEFSPRQFVPKSSFYSISPSREAHSFQLDQVPNFYDLSVDGSYLGESEVVFLVSGAAEYKEGTRSAVLPDGEKKEWKANVAEHHNYIFVYDRGGHFKQVIQLENNFSIQSLGVFSGGTFLAYGFDNASRSPRLGLVKEDGTLIEYLQLLEDYLPPDLKKAQQAQKHSPSLAPLILGQAQFVALGSNIIVASTWSRGPLLEISEAGAIRAIPVKLSKDEVIGSVLASETALYVRAIPASESPFLNQQPPKEMPARKDAFYEVSREDGTILKRLEVAGKPGPNVSCAHDNDFVGFTWSEKKFALLVGTAEPASNSSIVAH
jgi:hypothetical protein